MVSCLSIKFTSSLSPFCPLGWRRERFTVGASSSSPSGGLSRVWGSDGEIWVAAVPPSSWCYAAPGHVVSSALQLPSEAWGGKSNLEFPPSASPEAPHQPQGGSQRREQVLAGLNWGDQLPCSPPPTPVLPPPPSLPRRCAQTLPPISSLFSTAGEF